MREAVRLLASGQDHRTGWSVAKSCSALDCAAAPRCADHLSHLVHRGALGYLLAFASAVVLVDRFEPAPPYGAITLGAVGAWLAASFAVLPAYERARSWRPVLWLVALLGIGLVVAMLLGAEMSVHVRRGLIAGLGSAVTLAAVASATRMAFRRMPTVLVGDEPSVRRVATRWLDRKDVKVVATCAWRGNKPDIPSGSLSELIPQVLGAVARNHARSVVVASKRSLSTPMLRDLAWALQRAGVDCVVLADGNEKGDNIRARQLVDQMALTTRPPAEHLPSPSRSKALRRSCRGRPALLVLAPFCLIVRRCDSRHAARPSSGRPRTGRDGETYVMYTFRTTDLSPEEPQDLATGPRPATDVDRRATATRQRPQRRHGAVGPRPSAPGGDGEVHGPDVAAPVGPTGCYRAEPGQRPLATVTGGDDQRRPAVRRSLESSA